MLRMWKKVRDEYQFEWIEKKVLLFKVIESLLSQVYLAVDAISAKRVVIIFVLMLFSLPHLLFTEALLVIIRMLPISVSSRDDFSSEPIYFQAMLW